MKKALLFLNGQAPARFPETEPYQKIMCTDGAYTYLKPSGIIPDVISGDFDSLAIKPESIECIETPDQNFTDFEKALELLKGDYLHVDVYGASGNEQDHFLGNLSTAIKYKDEFELTFYDDTQYYFVASEKTELKNVEGKLISLVPMPTVKNITSSGLEFRLEQTTLEFGTFIGIRNRALEPNVEIRYERGELIIFVER